MPKLSPEKRRVQRMKDLLDRSLDQLAKTLDEARAFDAARTAGLLVEKIQLLEGKPTERIEWGTSLEDMKKMIVEAASKRGYRVSASGQREAEQAAIVQQEGQA